MNVRSSLIAGVAAFIAVAASLACSPDNSFQPITYGARPWHPPAGWNQETAGLAPCVTGYYVAIDSCQGCTTPISYALCVGHSFTQCVCGGPAWPGAMCPHSLVCCSNDFPPYNWAEYSIYTGPGWAGLDNAVADAGSCP